MAKQSLSQQARLTLFVLEAIALLIANRLATASWLPTTDPRGLWFYAALLGLLFGKRLGTPFFVRPVDLFLYSAPTLIAILQVPTEAWAKAGFWGQFSEVILITFSSTMTVIGASAIWLRDSSHEALNRLSDALRLVAERLGAPRVFFSVLTIFFMLAFNRSSAAEVFAIFSAWTVTVAFSPLDALLVLVKQVKARLTGATIVVADGHVAAYQSPGLLLLRQEIGRSIASSDTVLVNDDLGRSRAAVALDEVGRDEGLLVRALELRAESPSPEMDALTEQIPANSVSRIDAKALAKLGFGDLGSLGQLVGLVAPDTSTETLHFEVVKNTGIEEGHLVDVQIGERTVAYQIIHGVTKEEVVQQKNTFGYVRAQAQKIGIWDEASHRFVLAKWLPRPNAPVYHHPPETFVPRVDAVGHFPATNYGVTIKNIHDLVTHNTAILGILGVGKSTVAIELVERMIAAGIKVVVLDLTNQYATELAEYYDATGEVARLKLIQDAGEKDRDTFADNPEQGGSIQNLRAALASDLKDFISATDGRMLKIYNPAQFTGTKQFTEPKSYKAGNDWERSAALWSVTPVEATRAVTEAALALLQDQMTDKARVCLVYEEAHSLVPEMNAIASPADRDATNGTARAILQGRKYGLGCLLVTQRTASVTKTILNQCNTVFAMRTFDETGKDFLSNYIGKHHAQALSSLPERHAIVFGKASSCENPVLVRLNERDAFKRMFREKYPPKQITKASASAQSAPAAATGVEDDDIPF